MAQAISRPVPPARNVLVVQDQEPATSAPRAIPAIPARHLVGSMVLQEDNVMMLVVLPMAVSAVK